MFTGLAISTNEMLGMVLIISSITTLATESLKPILKEFKMEVRPNTLCALFSIICSVIYGVGYLNTIEYAFSTLSGVSYILELALISWIASMIGYDKLVQTFKQFKNKR